ncbi:MAG: peptide deformylase [Bacteroidales bacterium]
MKIYPIYVYGNSLLREVAKPISKDYEGLQDLIEDMFQTMYKSEGVGLAAPQIGKSIRIFVVDATAAADEENPELADFKKVFINPEILELSGDEWNMSEGCLSIPKLNEDVSRPDIVRIRYVDENFEEHEETYKGYAGRIIQHEYDHLEGRMFVDHLSPLRKKLIKKKLSKISSGETVAAYKTILPKKR